MYHGYEGVASNFLLCLREIDSIGAEHDPVVGNPNSLFRIVSAGIQFLPLIDLQQVSQSEVITIGRDLIGVERVYPNSTGLVLLENLRGVADRQARFVCVVALAKRGKLIQTFRGEVHGEILTELRGAEGFGYDPLFFYPPFGKSFGEISDEDKFAVSHRGIALISMVNYLKFQ